MKVVIHLSPKKNNCLFKLKSLKAKSFELFEADSTEVTPQHVLFYSLNILGSMILRMLSHVAQCSQPAA